MVIQISLRCTHSRNWQSYVVAYLFQYGVPVVTIATSYLLIGVKLCRTRRIGEVHGSLQAQKIQSGVFHEHINIDWQAHYRQFLVAISHIHVMPYLQESAPLSLCLGKGFESRFLKNSIELCIFFQSLLQGTLHRKTPSRNPIYKYIYCDAAEKELPVSLPYILAFPNVSKSEVQQSAYLLNSLPIQGFLSSAIMGSTVAAKD